MKLRSLRVMIPCPLVTSPRDPVNLGDALLWDPGGRYILADALSMQAPPQVFSA